MNYISESELKVSKDLVIRIRCKRDIYNIEIEKDIKEYNTHRSDITHLIDQLNKESVYGFFVLSGDKLRFYTIVKEKVTQGNLEKNINGVLASMISFISLMEVVFNER